MWNRAAIALSGLVLIVAPALLLLREAEKTAKMIAAWHEICIARASAEASEAMMIACNADHDEQYATLYPGWNEYGQFVLAVAVACLVAYLMVWAAVRTVRWVIDGREAK